MADLQKFFSVETRSGVGGGEACWVLEVQGWGLQERWIGSATIRTRAYHPKGHSIPFRRKAYTRSGRSRKPQAGDAYFLLMLTRIWFGTVPMTRKVCMAFWEHLAGIRSKTGSWCNRDSVDFAARKMVSTLAGLCWIYAVSREVVDLMGLRAVGRFHAGKFSNRIDFLPMPVGLADGEN